MLMPTTSRGTDVVCAIVPAIAMEAKKVVSICFFMVGRDK